MTNRGMQPHHRTISSSALPEAAIDKAEKEAMKRFGDFTGTIRGRLFLLLAVVFVPVLMVQAAYHYSRFERQRSDEYKMNLEVARAAAGAFEHIIRDIVHQEQSIGISLTPAQPLSVEEMNRILIKNCEEYPYLRNLSWVSPQGRITASSLSERVGAHVPDMSHINAIEAGREWIVSDLFQAGAAREPVFTVERGIRNERGELLGLVTAVVFPEKLGERIMVQQTGGCGITLFDSSGRAAVRHPPMDWSWEERNKLGSLPEFRKVLDGGEVAGVFPCPFNGVVKIIGFAPIPSIGWVVSAGRPLDAVIDRVKSQFMEQLAFSFILTIAVFLVALTISRNIENSVRRLREQVRAWPEGDSEDPAHVEDITEIRDLAAAFGAMARDVRNRENALRASEERLRTLFHETLNPIFMLDEEGKYIDANETALEFLECRKEDLPGKTVRDFLPPDTAEEQEQAHSPTMGRRMVETDYLVNGRIKTLLLNVVPVTVSGSRVVYEIGQDITDRKRAENALRKSEMKFRSLAENTWDYITRYDRDLRHTYVNAACARATGIPAGEFIGKTHRELGFGEEQCGIWEEKIRTVFDTGMPQQWEFEFDGAQGRIHLDWRLVPELTGDGKVSSVLGVSRDVTGRAMAADALRRKSDFVESLIETARTVILVLDPDGTIVRFNRYMVEISGFTLKEVKGLCWFETFIPERCRDDMREQFKKALEGSPTRGRITPMLTRDRKELQVEWYDEILRDARGRAIGLLAVGNDVTEKKSLEDQLRRAQKLEAIGTLAGGIAHDFNNILAAIIGYTEMVRDEIGSWNPVRDDLEEVLNASYRARDLVKQILTFGYSKAEGEGVPVKIAPVIEEALKMLRSSLPTTIEIRQHIDKRNLTALAHPTQIHQVLVNLCTNAAHAMKEKGGILTVSLDAVDIEPDDASPGHGLAPGGYLRLRISDTGHGMDAATMERIFDPYFTTKDVGEGSGLGLAVAHGIIKRRKGAVTVSSKPGQGATFDVYIPRLRDEAPQRPESSRAASVPMGGNERILLVDDEAAILKTGTAMLKSLGYQVSALMSGPEALEAFRSDPGRFDLVITDYTMPSMTGADLARSILGIRPDVPIILCTGFSEQIDEQKASSMGIREYMLKPVSKREMAETIRRALDGQGK